MVTGVKLEAKKDSPAMMLLTVEEITELNEGAGGGEVVSMGASVTFNRAFSVDAGTGAGDA